LTNYNLRTSIRITVAGLLARNHQFQVESVPALRGPNRIVQQVLSAEKNNRIDYSQALHRPHHYFLSIKNRKKHWIFLKNGDRARPK